MFGIIKAVARWYLNRPIVFEANYASKWLNEHSDITIISSPHAIEPLKSVLSPTIPILLNPPLEIEELKTWIPKINTKWIVGIGGGVIMDTTKFLAKEKKVKCCLIPSILSTTSWLNMGIALRQNNRLLMAGAFHAQQIIVDPKYILKSPAQLSLAGIADLLCLFSALGDWQIANKDRGEKISEKAVSEFKKFGSDIINHPEIFATYNELMIEKIYHIFLDALALCGASLSDRPLDGSEHFLYYCIDELNHKRFIHGNMIAMNILLSLQIQGEDAIFSPEQFKSFLKKAGILFRPHDNMLSDEDILKALNHVRDFVIERKYPYSIWNRVNSELNEEKKREYIHWISK